MLKVLAGLIPWVDIIKAAPQILSTAKEMLEGSSKLRQEPPPEPHYAEKKSTDESIRLLENETVKLRQYIAELQEDSRRQANLIQQIAEHDQKISSLLAVIRSRLILALGVSVISLTGFIACLLLLLLR